MKKREKTFVLSDSIYCRKVIDGDTLMEIHRFHVNDTDKMLEYYKSLGKWEDVDTDVDGDIILFETLIN